jgi:two-component system response regulator HydG
MPARILIVDDDRAFRLSTAALLRQEGYEVMAAADAAAAHAALDGSAVDLILVDLRMPGVDGLVLTEALRSWGERAPILMISGYATVDVAVSALHLGADDFLTKPVEPDVLAAHVAALLERRPRPTAGGELLPGLVGRSPAMQAVLATVAAVAPVDTTVLVTGETGTGKELVARAIHETSPRRGRPFVAVDCAALADGLVESELFGHVRGAFTGALRDREGFFQAADRGTIFLDEVGDMSPAVQHRLLRVLQEREVIPVGATRPARVDVRVVAATNRDLRAAVAAGRFREDLYYRLNVFHVALPPLRTRRGDVPLLVEHALARLTAARGRAEPFVCTPLAMRMLQAYDWPGNVRQLLAVVESATLLAADGRIEAHHLPAEVRAAAQEAGAVPARYRPRDPDADERAAIAAALAEADGVRARAAELLGMGRTTLWRKLKRYGLDAEAR